MRQNRLQGRHIVLRSCGSCPLSSPRRAQAETGRASGSSGRVMDCGRCGSAQPDDARYCGQCGTPVAAVACEPGMAPDVPRPVPPSGSSTALLTVVSRSRRKVLAVTGAAVVALAALAAIGWREHWPPALFGPANAQARTTGVVHGVPAAAVRVVANLVSRNPATVRGS